MPKNELVKGIDITLATATFNAAGTTSGSAGGMEIHAIDGVWHTGTLAHSSLSGVGANDHHNQAHVLATNTALGADHTISGATSGHVLRASSATAAAFAAIADADLPSTIVRTSRTITAGNGLTGGGDLSANRTIDVAVANTGATGLTVEVDAIRLTSSSAPGAAAAVLASTAAGALTLKAFTVNGTVGDATLDGTGARLSFSRVGANYVAASGAGATLRLGSNGTDSDITLDGANTRILIGNGLPVRSDTYVAGTTGWNLSHAGILDARKVETQWVEVTGTAGVAQLDSTGARLNFSRNSANYISAGTAGGSLRLGSNAVDNDLIIDGANARIEVGNSNTLRTPNYVSQLTGWAVTYAGAADYRYIYTDELHAKAFIADLEQALAGGQIISKSVALLGADFTCPAAGATATLTVKDLPSAENMAVFESGDIIRLRVFSRAGGSLTIANCWGVVTSYADQANKLQTWTFTRSSGGNAGSVAAGTVIGTDSIVLDYGTTGNGYHEVNAIDGLYAVNSPYSQVVTWTTHPATGQAVRTRLGNLKGVTGTTNEYGLYAGTGVTSSDQYLIASNLGLSLVNVDIDIYSSGTKVIRLNDTDGLRFRDGDYLNRKVSWANASDTTLASMGMLVPESLRIEMISPAATTATIVLEADGASYSNASLTLYSGSTASAAITAGSVDINVDPTNGPRFRSSASYYKLWNENNDGSGSGLDADKLDTYEAAAFPRLAASNTFTTTNTFNERITITAGSANVYAYLNSAGANENIELRFGNSGTSTGRLLYAGANSAGSKYFGFINSGSDYFLIASDDTRWTSTSGATQYAKLTSAGLRVGTGNITAGYALDVAGKALFDNGIRLALGDPTGAASTLTYTGDSTTSISTGVGAVKMRSTTGRTNTAFIAVYIGTTKYWIPAWSNID